QDILTIETAVSLVPMILNVRGPVRTCATISLAPPTGDEDVVQAVLIQIGHHDLTGRVLISCFFNGEISIAVIYQDIRVPGRSGSLKYIVRLDERNVRPVVPVEVTYR